MRKSLRKAAKSSKNEGAPGLREINRYLQSRREAILQALRSMVELESPSHDKRAVDRLGDYLSGEFSRLGAEIKRHRSATAGDQLQFDFSGGSGERLLLLGHHDTVYDVGTLATMPVRFADGKMFGPGVFDMKGGIAQMMFAIEALREVQGGVRRPLTVLLNADEEVGSDSSRGMTEKLAKNSAAVLVMEPSQGPQGCCKTARKGVGGYRIKVTGKAAHAGLDSARGQSAILELARQIERIYEIADPKRGITVNVGVIRGGTRTNVVAAEAVADVDVRIQKLADATRVEKRFRALRPVNKQCRLGISGGINRPPLERTTQVETLYKLARGIAAELEFKLGEAAVGGGSDGNFTAALGVPTLDGLGAVGECAHSPEECVVIAELPRRAALLAGLIQEI